MSREWQQTKMSAFVLPDAVYYQSLWAVRDLMRMEDRFKELTEAATGRSYGASVVAEQRGGFTPNKPTERDAMEKLVLAEKIDGIRCALSIIPEEYRSFVLSNIIYKNEGRAFPDKIWRMWKQKFLYQVALNLSMV